MIYQLRLCKWSFNVFQFLEHGRLLRTHLMVMMSYDANPFVFLLYSMFLLSK